MVAAAIIGGAVVGAGASAAASNQASKASQGSTNASIREQARQYDQTRDDFAPQRSLGNSSLDALSRLYGFARPSNAVATERANAQMLVGDTMLPAGTTTKSVGNGWYEVLHGGARIGTLRPGGANGQFINDTGADIGALQQQQDQQAQQTQQATTGAPDLGAFFESPDYQFNLQQGQQAIDRSLAARGRSLSGAGVKEGVRYASGLASGQYSDFTNRLLAMAGLGQAATTATAGAGANMANMNSNALLQNGTNRANIAMQNGANINNAAQTGISNWMLTKYLNQGAV